MDIHAPYRTSEVEVLKECNLSSTDEVERGGYVSPDKKIETFLQTGQLLQNYHAGGDDYEMQGDESDFEADTEEYRDELTNDAETYDEEPLPQFMDKLTAVETLDEADKRLENATKQKRRDKTRESENDASKAFLDGLESKIVSGIQKGIKAEKDETTTT